MKNILIFMLILSYGCSQVKTKFPSSPEETEEDVSIDAALNQAQASYLLGCVQALKPATSTTPVFPLCRDRAVKHRLAIEETIRQIPMPAIPQ